jgi:type IV secretory pathway TraG/TraD family ATPase VirD4
MGSLVVIDPKDENAAVTARRRREMGQEVHTFSIRSGSLGCRAHGTTRYFGWTLRIAAWSTTQCS